MIENRMSSFIAPQTIVVIGASSRDGSLGKIIVQNLLSGGMAKDNISIVNPKYKRVLDLPCSASVDELESAADLAVIVSPPKTVPGLIAELGQKGTRSVVVITAGFSEGNGTGGKDLEAQMLKEARQYNVRIIGPNCLGVISPINKLNASFSHLMPNKGKIGVISQSGAMLTSIIDWACGRGIGFSHLVSLGDMADITFGEVLDAMSMDSETEAIVIYMESVQHARRFISAARAASRTKPIVVLKVGRSDAGSKAVASHTGAMAGSDDVYQAVFDRSGLLRVNGMSELFYAAASLTSVKPLDKSGLAILTNGGGMGVLATDALVQSGGVLAQLSDVSKQKLDKVLPKTWSGANPIDIIGDAGPDRYAAALGVLQEDENIGAILVLNCPTAVSSSIDIAKVVADIAAKGKKCVLTSWVGSATAEASRSLFAERGIPSYATPESAVNSFMYLVHYRQNQKILMETPPALTEDLEFDVKTAQSIVDKAVAQKREWLNEMEAKQVLAAYGIPTVTTRLATTAEEAVSFATELGYPVAVKIFSPDILHKSDVQGVALNLASEAAVKQAVLDIQNTVQHRRPDAQIEGFFVQNMANYKDAHEVILGVLNDPTFGPVLMFGQGGTAVEVYNDKALALPPLNLKLAKDMVARTKIYHLLKGYRDREAVDMDALLLTLIKLSQLVVDFDRLVELDVNPLLVNSQGVVALDARIRISIKSEVKTNRLAIHPYPHDLEEKITLASGKTYELRPVRPEDEPALIENFNQLTKEEIRFRFFNAIKTMSHPMAARFSQIDYDREMALVITDPRTQKNWKLYAVVRLISEAFEPRAEFSLIVNHVVGRQGLGTLLLKRIIHYAESRGLKEVYGSVLAENKVMLDLCKRAGFTMQSQHNEPGVVTVKLLLNREASNS
ncbi:bifunctional acetate--CoA ligase family protein/GNAT family N-acetyltransferase [Cycloclasticus sp.]|uniref:bifunctional acetate--CoA ligase family protein/GNAT family N-acetyltransferase n=1 Tax=Cycloclasticus sp. TaxID=2024830 RepID=UPI000C12148D|nr:bifunctional acetate--CoA ligase family protein/GNAT family N-acetyltransferase [Cycloclasticus sp.]PHR48630.1 MAG: GNAT family N-acetyltransferase [Cycloclasticus sp.]